MAIYHRRLATHRTETLRNRSVHPGQTQGVYTRCSVARQEKSNNRLGKTDWGLGKHFRIIVSVRRYVEDGFFKETNLLQ